MVTRSDSGRLERRVVQAAESVLADQQFVSAVDVLVGLGWLPRVRLDEWRQGRVDALEMVVSANLSKISNAMALFRRWARRQGLTPGETAYVARTRDRRPLRFSRSGDPDIERSYRTHWVALSTRRRLPWPSSPRSATGIRPMTSCSCRV